MAYIADAYGPPQPVVVPKLPPEPVRYPSIDAAKGIAILALWLVNNLILGKETPDQLTLAPWGKVHVVDFIVPLLLGAIGASIAIAANFAARSHESFGAYIWRAFIRGFWIVVLGIVVTSAIARKPTMDMAAIQLVGIAYFVTSLFARTPSYVRAFLAAGLLLGYMAWIKLSPVPGAPPGTFTEKVNIVKYYNDTVLAAYGLRGLVALIPILAIMITGSVAGSLYRMEEFSSAGRGLMFIAGGIVVGGLGLLWTLDVPLSAAYWSSSYTLLAMGVAAIVLGAMSVLFDRLNGRKIAYPLLVPAASVGLALVGPPLVKALVLEAWHMPASNVPLDKGLQQLAINQLASPLGLWAYTIAFVLVWWIVAAVVYYKRRLGRIDAI